MGGRFWGVRFGGIGAWGEMKVSRADVGGGGGGGCGDARSEGAEGRSGGGKDVAGRDDSLGGETGLGTSGK